MAEKKKKAASKLSFGEAVDEIEELLARLEAEEIDIDDLSAEVRRAVELIGLCRTKLEKTDAEVRELVAELPGKSESGKSTGEDDEEIPF